MSTTLIFPPVVFSNFGRYYPSIAMLAGVLREHGLACNQVDVNALLFDFLLHPKRLQSLSNSLTRASLADSEALELLAARCASRMRDQFYDERERALSNPPLLGALEALSRPYYFDLAPSSLISSTVWEQAGVASLFEFLRDCTELRSKVQGAQVVGISIAMGPQLFWSLVIAKFLKEAHPHATILIGGPVITLLEDELLTALLRANRAVDGAIKFQGEEVLLEVVQSHGNCLSSVPGVLTVVTGATLRSPAKKLPRKLDHLPSGYYCSEILSRLRAPTIAVRQAEGCYWGRCAYCDYVELYPRGGPTYRPRSISRIVDDMRGHVEKDGVTRFCLITEALPPKIAAKLSEEIVQQKLDIRWSSFAMVDPGYTEVILKQMSASGCECLYVGLETTIERVLRHVEKRANRKDTRRFLELCQQAGVGLVVNLIPNLPTMTTVEADADLRDLNVWLNGVDTVNIFPFEATRSSKIGRDPEKYGLVVVESDAAYSGQAEFAANNLRVADPAMTRLELADVLQRYETLAADVSLRQNVSSQDRRAKEKVLTLSADAELHIAGDALVGFTGRTGRLTRFSPGWRSLLSCLADRRAVPYDELLPMLPEEVTFVGCDVMDLVVEKLRTTLICE